MRRTAWALHLAAVAISALVKLPSVNISRIKLCCDYVRVGAIVDNGNGCAVDNGNDIMKEERKGHVEFGHFG
ncbi:hypothetical protein K456DRAFT_51043 [Colletotrichum gloeosporioides 23]|nr:hypothetical protein K456DRAFT_51043 [Colletotrichum gloeosporioides 23]